MSHQEGHDRNLTEHEAHIAAELLNIREHLLNGVCGQRNVWVDVLQQASDLIARLTDGSADKQMSI